MGNTLHELVIFYKILQGQFVLILC